MRVLVGYASAHGSTAQIAERIADVLRGQGLLVDVVPIDRIGGPGEYDAVVLGSAVHNQAWLPEATEFVHRHRDDLLSRPVWLFSVGMSAALPRVVRGAARAGQNRALAEALRDEVRPRGHLLLSGVTRTEDFPRWVGFLFRGIGARFGDYRDWEAVEAWARDIAGHLVPGPSGPSPRT